VDNNNNQEMTNNIYSNNKQSFISPKLVFGILIFLGTGTLIYGFINLTKNIYNNKFTGTGNEVAETQQQDLVTDLLELQNLDTDKDGLTDYDEIYIYKTSAYLADTDSDGYLDKEEIDSNHDPLCPSGQDCRGSDLPDENNVNPENILPYDESLLEQDGSMQEQGANQEIPSDLMNELINLSPEQIRDLLRSSGQMTEEQLIEIDDNTLMEIYKEVLGQ